MFERGGEITVEVASLLYYVLALEVAVLVAAVALFFAFVPPARLDRRLLAVVLGVTAANGVYIFANLFAEADARVPGNYDLAYATGTRLLFVASAAFLVVFPRPPRARSIDAVAVGTAVLFILASTVVWFVAREVNFSTRPTGLRFSGIGLALWPAPAFTVLVVSALIRAHRLDAKERRGVAWVIAAVFIVHMSIAGGYVFRVAAWSFGWTGEVFEYPTHPSDTYSLHAVVWYLEVLLVPLALTIWTMVQWRTLAFAAGILFGVLAAGSSSFSGVFHVSSYDVVIALAPLYAGARTGIFGIATIPKPVASTLAGLMMVTMFLATTAYVQRFAPGSEFGLTLGIPIALVLGVAASLVALPLFRSTARADSATDSTTRRIEPYRVVLESEVAAGSGGAALLEKLRPLRGKLGITDQEHQVMVHVLGATRVRGSAESVPVTRSTERILDRYRVVRVLGTGGSGTAALCRDEALGREVVVKTLRPQGDASEGVASLLHEARAIGSVRHPNVVTIHDVVRVGDEACIVMEHVEGGSLRERIARGERFEGARLALLADELLAALEAVHATGIVHRDVKPNNVLLTREGAVKLADFGVAHLPGFETTMAPGGSPGAVGTIRYMSPEQARGRTTLPASDVYSAAATLFEAMTGRPYFESLPGESAVELHLRVAQGMRFAAEFAGPDGLRRWFASALAPEPLLRPSTASEARVAFAVAIAQRGA